MVLITIVTGAFVNQQTSLGASHCRTVGHLEIERNLERFQTFGVFIITYLLGIIWVVLKLRVCR